MIPRLRVSNTRLAQAASGCAPSVEVLPISDVAANKAECGNTTRMYGPSSLAGNDSTAYALYQRNDSFTAIKVRGQSSYLKCNTNWLFMRFHPVGLFSMELCQGHE
ncbi:hypothetical protein K0M31_004924 [Melipona bicolor]|uniref:Uncharacterized protein n=1 Tax=Melipona bicolor TaxID=60889 RepID=A0AA40KN65_9HYME|nr:hypothetical protein K0M31_004924 [Melipona bicolor]